MQQTRRAGEAFQGRLEKLQPAGRAQDGENAEKTKNADTEKLEKIEKKEKEENEKKTKAAAKEKALEKTARLEAEAPIDPIAADGPENMSSSPAGMGGSPLEADVFEALESAKTRKKGKGTRRTRKPKTGRETAEDGLRRLAFGDIADAVRLLYHSPESLEELECMSGLESLNLFAVSELKKGRDGLLEVKFYDRLKALQLLGELESGREDGRRRQE